MNYKGIKESLNHALFLTKCNKAIEKLYEMDRHTLSDAIAKAEKLQSDSSDEMIDVNLTPETYDLLSDLAINIGTTGEALLSFLVKLLVAANNKD